MILPIYVIDAFAEAPFTGNPAGVVPLQEPIDDVLMQRIAMEMGHAETAFLMPSDDGYSLRWFTPTVEVELCGHATLASAHVLWESGRLTADRTAVFHTRSGELRCDRLPHGIRMNFPSESAHEIKPPPQVKALFGSTLVFTGQNRMDLLIEVDDESVVRNHEPDFAVLSTLGGRGIILTAKAEDSDFVSRFFAPLFGVNEDPVTGSAHCCLGPYWSRKLGKAELIGYQASRRGGWVRVAVRGDRVDLIGSAVTVLEGQIRC